MIVNSTSTNKLAFFDSADADRGTDYPLGKVGTGLAPRRVTEPRGAKAGP